MISRTNLLFVIVALALASLGCQFLNISTTTAPGGPLFQDDFSDTSGGWNRQREAGKIMDYENGAYRIQVLEEQVDVWATPKRLRLGDVQVEVEATKNGGPDDNDFGIICRYNDESNFYFFIISSDGYYGIGKYKESQQALIGYELMPPSEAIQLGNASNHLRGDCVGSTLTLYINGQRVDSQEDSDFQTGNVGLLAGTFSQAGTDILFDNFKVIKP